MKTGVWFMSGNNIMEPELEGNGSGKSSIGESLIWLFCGKTSRNLKAKMVVNWNSKRKCYVKLTLLKDGIEHVIERGQSPNYLKVDNKDISQENLEKMFNINFDSLLYSVYISQFGSKFFDLQPAEKMKVFTSILGEDLEKWNRYSDYAAISMKRTEEKIAKVKESISYFEGALSSINIEKLKDLETRFEEERKHTIDEIKTRLRNRQSTDTTSKDKVRELKNNIAKIDERLKKRIKRLETIKTALVVKSKQYNELNENIIKIATEIDIISHNIKTLENLTTDKCPTCSQIVDKKHKVTTITSLKNKMLPMSRSLNDMRKLLNSLDEKISVLRENKEDLLESIDNIKTSRDIAQNRIDELKHNETVRKEAIEEIKKELKKEQERINPYTDMLKKSLFNVTMFTKNRYYLEDELTELNKILEADKYWKRGFKDIKLAILQRNLEELEIQINNHLFQLGMADWNIELVIDKDFSVLVQSPFGGGKVPIEVWSGGEGQRLRLAGTLGLMDFIHNRQVDDWNVEMFDEPTTWLSNKGEEQLLDTLYDRAKKQQKIIILADHRSFDTFGKFSGIIDVIKDESGTHVELR